MRDEFIKLHEKFFRLKCLFKSLDNTISFCSGEYAEIYYLDEFSKIIDEEFERLDVYLKNLNYVYLSKKRAAELSRPPIYNVSAYLFSTTACAAASFACGILNGEQDT